MSDALTLYKQLTHKKRAYANEFTIQWIARRVVNCGDTVIDCGANFGAHTLLFCELVGQRGQVLAVEADPVPTQKLLAKSATCPQLEVIPAAVSDASGVLEFYSAHQTGFSSAFEAMASRGGDARKLTVPAITLDSLISRIRGERLSFLKMDVEGSEVLALQGAAKILTSYSPVLVVELSWRFALPTDDNIIAFFEFLRRLGYGMFDFFGSEVKARSDHHYFVLTPLEADLSESVIAWAQEGILHFINSDQDWNPYAR